MWYPVTQNRDYRNFSGTFRRELSYTIAYRPEAPGADVSIQTERQSRFARYKERFSHPPMPMDGDHVSLLVREPGTQPQAVAAAVRGNNCGAYSVFRVLKTSSDDRSGFPPGLVSAKSTTSSIVRTPSN